MLTSNKGFEELGLLLGDYVVAAPLFDRLPHDGHIVNICGKSYQTRSGTALRLGTVVGRENDNTRFRLTRTRGGNPLMRRVWRIGT